MVGCLVVGLVGWLVVWLFGSWVGWLGWLVGCCFCAGEEVGDGVFFQKQNYIATSNKNRASLAGVKLKGINIAGMMWV